MSPVIERILEVARWAPSGDNAQPWRFEIVSDTHLVMHGFDTRDSCLFDIDGFGSQLAHGALLENISIVARTHGLATDIHLRPDSRDAQPRYDVRFRADESLSRDPLEAFIERRATQRRALSTRRLTDEEKRELISSISGHTILWHEGWRQKWEMARFLFASAKIRLTIPETYEVHRAAIEWNASFSETRIPDGALGLDSLTRRTMKWVMASQARLDFLNRYLGGHLVPRLQLDLLPALRCGAHFMILRNPRSRAGRIEDYVDSGRALQRFWLTATKLGLQIQPEMPPMLFGRYIQAGRSFTRVESAMQKARALAKDLDRLASMRSSDLVFMGRIGHGPAATARSRRRPLHDLHMSSSLESESSGLHCISSKYEGETSCRKSSISTNSF